MASTTFNKKSPTIKRIMKEAAELSQNPSSDLHAAPLESNLFEWHFTLRGPADSAFSSGIYHGRITLPSAYPLRPPSFRFLTPSARFEVNREICLSISGFHEETWQPAWGVRTALLALRSHMDVQAKGQVGGIESDDETRRRLAESSRAFVCRTCGVGKSNEDILREQEELAMQEGTKKAEEEKVPEELRLAYREELKEEGSSAGASTTPERLRGNPRAEGSDAAPPPPSSGAVPEELRIAAAAALDGMRTPRQAATQPVAARRNVDDYQLDMAIWILAAFLIMLVARKALQYL